MSSSPEQERTAHIGKEIRWLEQLVQSNPQWLKILHEGDNNIILRFAVPSFVVDTKDLSTPRKSNKHIICIQFPLEYPFSDKLIVDIDEPVLFHPYVPSSGHWKSLGDLQGTIRALWGVFTYQPILLDEEDKIHNSLAFEWYRQFRPNPTVQQQLDWPLEAEHQRITERDSESMDSPTEQFRSPGQDLSKHPQQHVSDPRPIQLSPSRTNVPTVSTSNLASSSIVNEAASTTSGFKRKALRTHRPQEWDFPQKEWIQGPRNYYRGWQYNVHTFSDESSKALKVVILDHALEKIFSHASRDRHNERFGILIGGAFSDPATGEHWVEIVDMLAAQRVQANIASVEVSPEEIGRLNAEIDLILTQTQETVRKIGWYHTHPGHGIFMSGTDQTNQKLCYTADWQMALVVDPIRKQYGIFAGPRCIPLRYGMLVVSEETAQAINTPAYQSWQHVGASQSLIGAKAIPETIPYDQEIEPQVTPSQPVPIIQSQKSRKRVRPSLRNSSWVSPLLLTLLLVSLLATLILSILLGRMNNTYSAQAHRQQQQLNSTNHQLQTQERTLQQTQQALLEKARQLEALDVLAYRRLLEAVVSMDRNSSAGLSARTLLQQDVQYTVMSGDTLSTVATNFTTTVQALYEKNPTLKPKKAIVPDQVITIPGENF